MRAAAQRVPFPEISASLPSALNNRIEWPRINIQPSAPMPVWRLQMARAVDGRSTSGTCCDQESRKSFPAPCALVKGIGILVAFVNFDHRSAFDLHCLYQMITGPGPEG